MDIVYSPELIGTITEQIEMYGGKLPDSRLSEKISAAIAKSYFTPVDLDLGYAIDNNQFRIMMSDALDELSEVAPELLTKKLVKKLQSSGFDFKSVTDPTYIPETQSAIIDKMVNTHTRLQNLNVVLRHLVDGPEINKYLDKLDKLTNTFEQLRYGCFDLNYVPTVQHQELVAQVGGVVDAAAKLTEEIDEKFHLSALNQPAENSFKRSS